MTGEGCAGRRGPIVVLSGAGISVELGLPSFRGAGGLWHGWRLEDVATPEAFARDPVLVQRFYDARRRQLLEAAIQPNAAHRALAELERRWPDPVLVVTQNIDDLHERAGTRNLIHMHGELLRRGARCAPGWCPGATISPATIAARAAAAPAACAPTSCGSASCRSSSTRFTPRSRAAGGSSAIGTSGQVYPAAGFVEAVRAAGRAHTVELNLEASAFSTRFAEHRQGPAAELVPRFVAELLASVDR